MKNPIENTCPARDVLEGLPLPATVRALPLALLHTLQAIAILDEGITEVRQELADGHAALAAEDETVEATRATADACRRLTADLALLTRERALAMADVEALRMAAALLAAPLPNA